MIFFLSLGMSSTALAFSIGGEIRKADDTALESSSVTFQFEVLNPSQSCVIFREVHSNLDMTNSAGHFSMVLGEGSRAFPSAGIPLQTILSNSSSLISCEAGGTYTPTLTDTRFVRVSFKDNTEGSPVFRTITPSLKISPMAWSYNAEDTTKLGGLTANQYLQKPGAACPGGSVATFDGTALQCISLSTFTFDWSQINNKPSTFTPSAHTHLIDEVNSAAGKYFSYRPNNVACATNEVLKWDGSRWTCGTDNAGVASSITALTGDVTASGTGSVASTVNSVGGKTAAQVATAVDSINNANSVYLAKAGGTMTGAINMGGQNLTNSGYITMNANSSLHLSNNASAPGGLVTADKGKMWFNSAINKIEYWDGTAVKAVSEGTQASDLTSITGTGIVQRNGAGSYSTLGVTAPLAVVAGNIVLNNTAVTAGTYGNSSQIPTFSVDAQGRITLASNVAITPPWSSITSKPTTLVGYGITDAVSKAGDVMTGSLGLGNFTNAAETTLTSGWGAGDKGKTWFNTTTNQVKYWDGSSIQALGVSGAGLTSFNGQSGSTQTLAVGTTGTAPAFSSASNTHTLNIPMASTAGTTAGLLSKTDYDAFAGKLGTSSAFSGDVSGTSSTMSVDKIKGTGVNLTALTSGQFLKYDGTNWVNTSLGTAATKSTGVVSGDVPLIGVAGITNNSMCTSDGTGAITCSTAIPSASGDFKADGSVNMTGTLKAVTGTAALPGVTFVGDTNTGIYSPSADALALSTAGSERLTITSIGRVGIGTSSPMSSLDLTTPTSTGSLNMLLITNPVLTLNKAATTDSSAIHFRNGGTMVWALGDNTGNAFNLWNQGTSSYVFSVLASNGNVGIGTTTPAQKLEVKGAMRLAGSTSGFVDLQAPASGGNAIFTLPAGAGTNGQVLSTDGSGVLSWITPSVGGTGDFKADGSVAMTGSLKGFAGTAASPSYSFSTSTGTGIFLPASQTLAFSTNGSERMRISPSSGFVGIGTTSPAAALDVKGEFRLSGSTSGFVGLRAPASGGNTTFTLPSLDGSSGQVLSTNGSGLLSWVTPSGAGLTSLNGLTTPAQTLAVNTTGSTLQFNSAASTHTLSIPMASNSGVAAGLISKIDYDNFSAKLDGTSAINGDVTGTISSSMVSKIQGINVQAPTVSGQFLIYNGSQFNSVLMSGDGTLSASGNFSLGSDIIDKDNFEWTGTISAGSRMVLVDGSGKFTDLSCGTVGQAVVWTATGFTCVGVVSTTGGAMFGDLKMANNTQVRFEENIANGNNQIALRAPANLPSDFQLTLPTTPGTAGQVLSTDGAGNLGWQNLPGATPARVAIQAFAGANIPDRFDQYWNNYGSGYANASYTLKNQEVRLRGSVTTSTPINNACIFNLPAPAQPNENLVFVVPRITGGSTRGVCQIEVKTTGCVYAACASLTNSGDMISLDNIQYETY